MEDTLKNAYAEVEQILNFLGEPYKQKVPKKLITLFKEKKNANHRILIDSNVKIEDIKLSRTTLIIISILNLKYWEKDLDKKEKLKKIYDANECKYQDKINVYKQSDWLKNRRNINENPEVTNETSLVEIKKNSIIDKIKMFFKKLFHGKK